MTTYQPKQRIVPVDILCQRGWLSAKTRVGETNYFLDVINAVPHFIRLSDVIFEDGKTLPFLGLQRQAIDLMIPREAENQILRENPAEKIRTEVLCLFKEASVQGELKLLPEIRMSDYMSKCSGFFALHKTSSDIWKSQDKIKSDYFSQTPIALVNAQSIIGITEVS